MTHEQAVKKATREYKKYKERTLSDVEQDYLNAIKMLEKKRIKVDLNLSDAFINKDREADLELRYNTVSNRGFLLRHLPSIERRCWE